MILKDQTILKDLQAGLVKREELTKHLLNNFPATTIASELAGYLLDDMSMSSCKKVNLTTEQFTKFFKVQGWKFQDGQWIPETRGNFSKKEK